MDDGKVIYYGDVEGLMEVVDYRRIKLPASVVIERATKPTRSANFSRPFPRVKNTP